VREEGREEGGMEIKSGRRGRVQKAEGEVEVGVEVWK